MIARCLACLGFLLLGLPGPADAGRILDAAVSHVDERYSVRFAVVLDGQRAKLAELLRDYGRLAALSPTVKRSRVIAGADGDRDARIELRLRPCVLVIFCKTLTKVSDVHVHDQGNSMTFVAVPALSDFREAREIISLTDASTDAEPRVRFEYNASLEPKFNVPPFVGPWLIERQILRDLEVTTRNVERVLNQGQSVDENEIRTRTPR